MHDKSALRLDDFVRDTWSLLKRATVDKRHPFRTVVVSTIGSAGPESRTMIMRQFDTSGSILLFTDSRSAKVTSITDREQVALLWWSPRHRIQVRMQAKVVPVVGSALEELLPQTPNTSQDYRTVQPPGTPLPHPEAVAWSSTMHFLAYQTLPQTADILQLTKEGHTRAQGSYDTTLGWEWQWVVP